MTEEIIIDGVNVAGCEHHLSTGYCQLQMIFQGMVLKLPFGKHLECNLCDKDCYYKQLKRLEQENAELKAENERLKEEIETRDNLIDHFRDEALYRATIASEYQKDKTKLEQTLQEIKKICKMDCGECQYNQDCDCNFEECEEAKIDDILDLITKNEEGK